MSTAGPPRPFGQTPRPAGPHLAFGVVCYAALRAMARR